MHPVKLRTLVLLGSMVFILLLYNWPLLSNYELFNYMASFPRHQDIWGEKQLKVSKAWLMLTVGSKIRTSPSPPESCLPPRILKILASLSLHFCLYRAESVRYAWKPTCGLKNSINSANLEMLLICGYNMQFCSFSPYPYLYTWQHNGFRYHCIKN